MDHATKPSGARYLLAGSVGALVGGILVLIASDAIPKMLSGMMAGMMSNMMSAMGQEGCSPSKF
jgi:hypothetical protein